MAFNLSNLTTTITDMFSLLDVLVEGVINLVTGNLLVLTIVLAFLSLIIGFIYLIFNYVKQHLNSSVRMRK